MASSLLLLNPPADVNPNNIYLSHVDGASPVAKLGDLGNSKNTISHLNFGELKKAHHTHAVVRDNIVTERCQSLECRAPEVWQGQRIRHAADIWSLGSTVRALSIYQSINETFATFFSFSPQTRELI